MLAFADVSPVSSEWLRSMLISAVGNARCDRAGTVSAAVLEQTPVLMTPHDVSMQVFTSTICTLAQARLFQFTPVQRRIQHALVLQRMCQGIPCTRQHTPELLHAWM